MADYRPNGSSRTKIMVFSLLFSVIAVALVATVTMKLDLLSDPAPVASDLPIAVSSSVLDFGSVPLNGAVIRHLVVRNEGTDPLHANLLLDGAKYSVTPSDLILHPGISSRIQIAVRADALGDLRDQLRIQVDDGDISPLVISLRGEATPDDGTGVAPAREAALPARPQLRADVLQDPARTAGAVERTAIDGGDSSIVSDLGLVADASTGQRAGRRAETGAAAGVTPAPTAVRRRPAATDDSNGSDRDSASAERNARGVGPYVAGVSVPIRSIAEAPVPITREVSEAARANAHAMPSRTTDGDELPERLPEDEPVDDFDRDIFDDESDDTDPDPFVSPTFAISAVSEVGMIGSKITFYPQEIPVLGTEAGGSITLAQNIEFPMTFIAFGESMLFRQVSPASGIFDAGSGTVELQLVLEAVDTDGDAAPVQLTLTTGTVYAQDPFGQVVSKTGIVRSPATGIVKLVGIFEIPSGYGNNAEKRLVHVEILGDLDFGNTTRQGLGSR